jgi:RNA polymerase sigma-54 factor
MKMNLNLGQGIGQQQQLNLAPQLLQWLRLLQVPAQQLDLMVTQELEVNPALELAELELDADEWSDELPAEVPESQEEVPELADEHLSDMDERMQALAQLDQEWDGDDARVSAADVATSQERMEYRMNSLTEASSMRDRLMKQIAVMGLTAAQKEAAEWLVGSLDERGYLDVPVSVLAEESGLSEAALLDGLQWVQSCEPAGIGARDLQECLLLQLSSDDPEHALPCRLIQECLESVAQQRLDAIAEYLDVELEDVEEAVHLIRTLNPYPGQVIQDDAPISTITPDIIIRRKEEGGLEIELADRHAPRLRISHSCRALIEQGDLSRNDLAYVRNRVRAAMFLIEGLRKRESTLQRIAEEIVRVQHRFLTGAERDTRPLTMAKVAAIIGVHDTTVSRALAEKYVETPVGLFPMKHFFQTGYQCEDGSALTPEMVRRRIHRIILNEDPAHPIKDETIAQQLQKDGIPVARRTVAKYRGELGIASSKERAVRGAAATEPVEPVYEDAIEVEERELAYA